MRLTALQPFAADGVETLLALGAQFGRAQAFQFLQGLIKRFCGSSHRPFRVTMCAADWLLDDTVDDFGFQQVRRCDFHGVSRILRLGSVAIKDRSAAFRRDHRIDGVLHHQDLVGRRDTDRAARHALADDQRDERHAQ